MGRAMSWIVRACTVGLLTVALVGQAVAQDMRPTAKLGSNGAGTIQALTPDAPANAPNPQQKHPDYATMALEAVVVLLMKASVWGYTGNCACPHYSDRAGRSCGARSAYVKPNGAKPLCYPTDVTPQMIAAFRSTGIPAAALALNPHP